MTEGQQIIRPHGRVVVCAADPRSRDQLSQAATQQGYEVDGVESIEQVKDCIARDDYVVALLDEPQQLEQILDLEQHAREREKTTQFIILPAMGQHVQFRLIRRYSCDVIDAPYTFEKLSGALFSAAGRAQLVSENLQLKRRLISQWNDEMVGHSQALQQLRMRLQTVAENEAAVLICGEAGSGIDTAARTLNRYRNGSGRSLVKLDAATLSDADVAAELSGQDFQPHGNVDLTQIGLLFIDNCEGLSLEWQQRLARGLRARRLLAGDGQTELPIECKVAFGTHANLAKLAAKGLIHAELAPLLAESAVVVPPLRDRREDVGLLAEHFAVAAGAREGREVKQLSLDVIRRLADQQWDENIRELQLVIDRCVQLEPTGQVELSTLESWLEGNHDAAPDACLTLREMERKLIEATFNRFGGNREQTAKALQIGLRTLSGKLREYGYPPRGGPGSNKTAQAAQTAPPVPAAQFVRRAA